MFTAGFTLIVSLLLPTIPSVSRAFVWVTVKVDLLSVNSVSLTKRLEYVMNYKHFESFSRTHLHAWRFSTAAPRHGCHIVVGLGIWVNSKQKAGASVFP
jgi:hypothetical protein